MKVVAGNCRGTGQIMYLCIGFVPDWVRIYNYGDAGFALPFALWHKHWSADAWIEGASNIASNMSGKLDLTQAEGIQPYYGGTLMTSTTQPSITYGHANVDFVTWDYCDYRYAAGEGPFPRQDAEGLTIDTWKADTPASYTGSFNDDVVGAYIGPGSRICIEDKWYTITVLAAGAGAVADAVQLSKTPVDDNSNTLSTGRITYISGMYGNCGYPVARGDVAPAGFKIAAITNVNVITEMFAFEAGLYDN